MERNILTERFKNFDIKFYQEGDKVIYESGFTQGEAATLNDAFKEFSREDFARDLYYYYDDVHDVRFGRFIPSLNDKIRKGRKYLGKLEMWLDIEKGGEEKHSADYLKKHKEEIPNHLEYIKSLKNKEEFSSFWDKLKEAVKNLFKKNEMFDPIKSSKTLICEHCGSVIPASDYFETWRGNNYHLECIWDKLVGKKNSNEYDNAKEFFFSLQEKLGNWPPYGYDLEEDYLSDLELVKHNYRKTHENL